MTAPTQAITLLDLTRTELANLLAGWSQPRLRSEQVWEWLYKKLAADPTEMTNLPKALHERLTARHTSTHWNASTSSAPVMGRRSSGFSVCTTG